MPSRRRIVAAVRGASSRRGTGSPLQRLELVRRARPEMVTVVSWAASNGDRSENGDYLYGKKRLREIDRRIRFLTKRLELAEVVDPEARLDTEQVFFGATVEVLALTREYGISARLTFSNSLLRPEQATAGNR